MVESKQDELARAYTMLKSLRKNIGQMTDYSVPEIYVREFHTVLDRLEVIKIDVSEFHIPDSVVKPKVTSQVWTDRGSHKTYSEEKYVERSFILTKLDAILGYFEIITSEEPREIGFRTPDKK